MSLAGMKVLEIGVYWSKCALSALITLAVFKKISTSINMSRQWLTFLVLFIVGNKLEAGVLVNDPTASGIVEKTE
jgi:hypothetical protein